MKRILLSLSLSVSLFLSGSAQKSSQFHAIPENDPELQEFVEANFTKFQKTGQLKSNTEDIGNPPPFNWVKTFGGSSSDNAWDIEADQSGNLYICGEFSGELDFFGSDINTGNSIVGYLCKMDQNGNIIWLKQFSGEEGSNITAGDLTIDENDNVYICGQFDVQMFSIGTDIINRVGETDLFAAKFDKNGNYMWSWSLGNEGYVENVREIKFHSDGVYIVRNNGLLKLSTTGNLIWDKSFNSIQSCAFSGSNILVTGTYRSYIQFESGEELTTEYAGLYTLSLDASGDILEAKGFDAGSYTTPNFQNITGDGTGGFVIGGYFYESMVLGENNLSAPDYSAHMLVFKIDEYLEPIWYIMPDESSSYVYDISITNSSVYLSGQYTDDLTINSEHINSENYFLLSLDLDGNIIDLSNLEHPSHQMSVVGESIFFVGNEDWDCQVFETGLDGTTAWFKTSTGNGGYASIWYQFDVDDHNNIYMHGLYSGTVDFGESNTTGDGIFTSKLNSSGEAYWVRELKGTSATSSGIIADKEGGVYAWGTFSGELEGDIATISNEEANSIYLAKYDSQGDMKFFKSFRSTGNLIAVGAIALDGDNNICLTGMFTDELSFSDFSFTSGGGNDAFLIKLNSNGNLLWAKQFEGLGQVWSRSVACDKDDNIYVTGGFNNHPASFDNLILYPDSADLGSSYHKGTYTGFVAMFNPEGEVQWANTYGNGNYYSRGHAIEVSETKDAFVTGLMWNYWSVDSIIKFGDIELEGKMNHLYDMFLAKYDSSGEAVWAKLIEIEGDYSWPVYKMGMDPDDNVYVGGSFIGSLKFGRLPAVECLNGTEDLFVAKYSSDGSFRWAKIIENEDNGFVSLFSIEAVTENQVFAGGRISNNSSHFDDMVYHTPTQHAFLGLIADADITIVEDEIKNTFSVSVFPNPSEGAVNVIAESPVQLSVYSLSGIMVRQYDLHSTTQTIDLSDLAKGIYLIQADFNGLRHIEKLVIK